MTHVSLIIPTYNRGEVLCRTIAMALAQTYASYEVLVIDQSQTIDTMVEAYLQSVADRVQYIRLPTPNLPAARNVGVRAATGEIVIFLDDDVVIEPNYITLHVRNFADRSIGAAAGVIVNSFDESVSLPLDSNESRRPASRWLDCWPDRNLSKSQTDGVTTLDWVCGGNTAYLRQAIIDAGFSDERFGGTGWCEDADLSTRVRHRGYTLLLDTRIKMIHLNLPSGGCQNRNQAQRAAVERDQLRLFLLFLIKNRHIIGYGQMYRGLLRVYRRCALNRAILRQGLIYTVRQHRVFSLLAIGAFRSLLSRQAVLV
jgi:GT2 family glycosyltransferase